MGTYEEHQENLLVTVAMLLVTLVYEYGTSLLVPDFALNPYELVGVWSGLVCVWLTRTQNVLCWPWGILSSAALGMFFMQIGLPGQQWLNWGYFLVIQLWAWPYWVFGGKNRTMLKVTRLDLLGRLYTLAAIALGTLAVYVAIDLFAPGSLYPALDALVVASSVVAQFLLGRKNIESWFLWLGPVNLVSICLFFMVGAYTLTALYIAFFIHAAIALTEWSNVSREKIHA
jgi:nicotinamide mononucleotide transporter